MSAAVSFAPDTAMHSAEDVLIHEIAEIFAEFVQSRGAKSKADATYIKSHLEVLGLDKMCLALEQKYGEPPLDAIMQAFSLFDSDGDGHITPDELLTMLSTVDNNLEEDTVADLMTKADLDGDGVISFEEFYQLIMGKPPPEGSSRTAKNSGHAVTEALDEAAPSAARGASSSPERQRTPPRPQTPPDEDVPATRGLASLAMAALDGGSTTEEEEPEQGGELTLQDRIDDALDGGFSDISAMRALLAEVQSTGYSHPSVMALEVKLEDLGSGAEPAAGNQIGADAGLAGRLLLGGLGKPIAEPEPESEESGAVVSAPGKLRVKVWEARNIPKMDRFGKTDAYIEVNCGGHVRETSVVESQNPYWGTEFELEVTDAKFAMVTVLDKDAASSEKIGEIRLLLADFVDSKEQEGWHTLKPSAGGVQMTSPKSRRRMSITYVPDTSKGLGDVRLSVTYTPPVEGTIGPPKKKVLHPVGKLGVMHVTVLQARGLPKMDRFSHTDSYAKVQFMDEVGDTFVAMDTEDPKWNQEFQFEVDTRKQLSGYIQCSVWDKDDGPDPDDVIGQAQLELHDDLLLGREDNVWLQLRAAEGSPGGKALGQLNLKVSFETARAPEWDDDLDGKYDPIRSAYSYLKMTSPVHRKNEMLKAQPRFVGKVACCIMEGRGLPKMDRFGGTDAYVEVEFAGMVRHSDVAKDGAQPFWNAQFDFDVESRQRGLKMTVYDQELRGEDEPIGRIVLPVNAATLGMEEGQMGEALAEGQWRELERVEGGPKLPPGQSLGEIFIKVMWISASSPASRPGGASTRAAGTAASAAGAVALPRLSKVTPKMGWGKLKLKAAEDQQHRVDDRGPMDVNQMLNVWKKGAPIKARVGAMFSKAKSMGVMMMRRGSVVQSSNLTVDVDFGGEAAGGPHSAPGSGKRSLKGMFGKVKTANMLRSPGPSDKYGVEAPNTDSPKSTRSLKSVFGSVKNANALRGSPAAATGATREAWSDSPSANATAPGEMRDDDDPNSSPQCVH